MALVKTKGLVLRSMKYRESSLICDIYCRELGMRSFIVQGARKQKSRVGAGFFQPMQILSLVVYDQPGASLHRIKEVSASGLFLELQTNIPKSAVGLFLLELARRSIREETPNEELFDFLEDSLDLVEKAKTPLAVFPLWLGLRMTTFLGFGPHIPETDEPEDLFFDLREGTLSRNRPFHPDIIAPPMASTFALLSAQDVEEITGMHLARDQRDQLFDRMIDYYRLHIAHFGKLRSPDIFRELF